MSAAAWRWIWQRSASHSDLWRLTQLAAASSSRCPSAQERTVAAVSTPPPFSSSRSQASASGFVDRMPFPSNHRHLHQFSVTSSRFPSASAGWWRRPAARKDRIFTLPEPARFYCSGASRVRQFGTANQRPASPSDPGRRVPQISGACSSGSPSAQAMTEAAAWRRPTSPSFSSSRGQASATGFIDRMPCPSNLRHLLQFFGTSSRSLSESAGWWRRRTAWKGRIYALHEPARLFLSGLGQVRQFGTANQLQRQATKPHLYLVLDDHENGFTIHKLDIDNDLDVGCGSAEAPWRLPNPPVLRLGPPTIGKSAQFAALGSHIIGICRSTLLTPMIEDGHCGVTLTFDTKTATLSVSKVIARNMPYGYEVAIAVRNRLYVFESFSDNNDGSDGLYFRGGLHCLAADPKDDEKYWIWRPLFHSSQFSWSWTNYPPEFPFDPQRITAYVVHPRTGTIFVSASGHASWATFSYGSGGNGQWKRRGDWVLPFKGPAHYDHVLGAWVGLHLPSPVTKDTDGYLCACCVVSGWQRQPPKWKVGREKLFLEHPQWRHVDVKLVHMGEGSKYCLMEQLQPEGAVDKLNCMIRLTTFIVKYGEDGELRTMAHRPARFYKVPSYRSRFVVQAFWM